jgi:hypothetical protein
MTDEHLRSLLRQRGGDHMPPGYLDSLLPRLQQRQRTELLQRSLWQIASDRIGTFWSEHSTSSATYAFAVAALFVVGAGVIFTFQPRFSEDYAARTPAELAVAAPESRPKKASRANASASAENAPVPLSPLETQQVSFGKQKD